jgi:hypothetical protein
MSIRVKDAHVERAETTPAPQGVVVIRGDPREDPLVFEQLVDAVRGAFSAARDGVVHVAFRFEGDAVQDYLTLARPFYGSEDYVVVMDEDGRPLYVIDRTAQTWDDAVGAVLGIAAREEDRIAEVRVEVGKRW